jgi:hypothetical protein
MYSTAGRRAVSSGPSGVVTVTSTDGVPTRLSVTVTPGPELVFTR